jgi:hypothetical protein
MEERASRCEGGSKRWQADADVWAATVGKLAAEKRGTVFGELVTEPRDYAETCSTCRAPADVPCLPAGQYPVEWSPADEACRAVQGAAYARDGGNRAYIEGLAHDDDAKRAGL